MVLFNKKSLHLTIYVILSFVICLTGLIEPKNNFDLVFYTGSSFSLIHSDIDKIHESTYELLGDNLPKSRFEELTGGEYGKANYNNVNVFREQLSFYRSRVVYYSFPVVFSYLGINILDGFYLTSFLFSFISLIVLFFISVEFIPIKYVSFLPLLLSGIGFVSISRLSTPDSMACFGVLITIYAMMKYHSRHLILLPIIILFRRDLFIFSCLVLLVYYVKNSSVGYKFVLSSIFCFVIYYLSTRLSGHPGWSTVISHTFDELILYPVSNPATVSPKEYALSLFSAVKSSINNSGFTIFLFSSFTLLYARYSNSTSVYDFIFSSSNTDYVLFPSISYVFAHILLFPAVWNRFFVPFYSISVILLLYLIYED